jgi:hypothetical protein
MALRENMAYDSLLDEYTCQQGKKLQLQYEGIRRSKSGFESQVSYYECEGCDGCPGKKQCARSRGNRKLQVSKRFIAQRAESLARIISGKGIMLRMNRSIQVEGTFGVIKQNYAFGQFMLRGHRIVLLYSAYSEILSI